jgi:hypothetical protein
MGEDTRHDPRSRARMATHRMFQVIVLGGVAIATTPALGCGGSLAKAGGTDQGDASSDAGFPTEGPAYFDSGFPVETAPPSTLDSGFPTEGPADSGFPVETAPPSTLDSGFPTEGPAYYDSGFPTEGPDTGTPDAEADAEVGDAFPQDGPGPK